MAIYFHADVPVRSGRASERNGNLFLNKRDTFPSISINKPRDNGRDRNNDLLASRFSLRCSHRRATWSPDFRSARSQTTGILLFLQYCPARNGYFPEPRITSLSLTCRPSFMGSSSGLARYSGKKFFYDPPEREKEGRGRAEHR